MFQLLKKLLYYCISPQSEFWKKSNSFEFSIRGLFFYLACHRFSVFCYPNPDFWNTWPAWNSELKELMMKYSCKDLVLVGFSFISWSIRIGKLFLFILYCTGHHSLELQVQKKKQFKLTNQVAPSSVTGSLIEEREWLRSTTSALMQKSPSLSNPFSDKHKSTHQRLIEKRRTSHEYEVRSTIL